MTSEALTRVDLGQAAIARLPDTARACGKRFGWHRLSRITNGACARRTVQRTRSHGPSRINCPLPGTRQTGHARRSSPVTCSKKSIASPIGSVLMTGGYVIAEGNIHQVRQEVRDKPMQILVRCARPEVLASRSSNWITAWKPASRRWRRCIPSHPGRRPVLHPDQQDRQRGTGEDRSDLAGRRRCERHLPIPDRLRRRAGHDRRDSTG